MHKRGFTLIELLVVIAIIGVLASIVMVSLSGAKSKSRDSKRQADIKSIQLALAMYYNDNGMYPTNIYAAAGAAPAGGLKDTYLPVVPTDPNVSGSCTGTEASCYKYAGFYSGGAGGLGCSAGNRPPARYHLGAVLENLVSTYDSNAPVANSGSMAGYQLCNNSSGIGNFDGTSVNCSSTAGVAYGQANATEKCYDQIP
jgi:type II secretion system protein G